jgi:hypothetical protein
MHSFTRLPFHRRRRKGVAVAAREGPGKENGYPLVQAHALQSAFFILHLVSKLGLHQVLRCLFQPKRTAVKSTLTPCAFF